MIQIPDEDDTPFSLPRDVPEIMPVDYPDLDSNVDLHEAYDEGLDDVVDFDPYRLDDDPIKSSKRLMKAGLGGHEWFTIDHDIIRRWSEQRNGQPAHIKGTEGGLDKGGLCIRFQDEEPELAIEMLTWDKFFKIFEKNKLAFLYKDKSPSGAESRFYKFVNRSDIGRISSAREQK